MPTAAVAGLQPRCFQADITAHGHVRTRAGHLVFCSVHLTLTISISFHQDFIIMVVKGCGIFLLAAWILAFSAVGGGGGAQPAELLGGSDGWLTQRSAGSLHTPGRACRPY